VQHFISFETNFVPHFIAPFLSMQE